jgi:hypothetical protein
MIRKIACAVFILGVSFSLALGEEFGATIKKVEDGKITFVKRDKETKKETGDAITLPATDKVKVVRAKFNKETMKLEAGDDIKDGLKNEMFSKIGEKGLIARVVTDDDGKKITEIRVFQFGGKKKKDAN